MQRLEEALHAAVLAAMAVHRDEGHVRLGRAQALKEVVVGDVQAFHLRKTGLLEGALHRVARLQGNLPLVGPAARKQRHAQLGEGGIYGKLRVGHCRSSLRKAVNVQPQIVSLRPLPAPRGTHPSDNVQKERMSPSPCARTRSQGDWPFPPVCGEGWRPRVCYSYSRFPIPQHQ